MKLTYAITLIQLVNSGWSLAAFIAFLIFLYASRE
jgi:hypothetical protein